MTDRLRAHGRVGGPRAVLVARVPGTHDAAASAMPDAVVLAKAVAVGLAKVDVADLAKVDVADLAKVGERASAIGLAIADHEAAVGIAMPVQSAARDARDVTRAHAGAVGFGIGPTKAAFRARHTNERSGPIALTAFETPVDPAAT